MSDTTTTTSDGASTDTGKSGEGGGQVDKAFTQADVDRLIGERLKRENVSELRAKAAELDQLKAANKTADEKAEERLAKLEADLASERTAAMRLRIAAKHGIDADDIDLFLTGSDEETVEKQAKALAAKARDDRNNGRHVAGEGTNTATQPADSERRAFVRRLTGRE